MMPVAAVRQNPARPLDAEALLAWYDRHARTLPWRVGPADRARGIRPDPYRVWLSEIMLQQTTVATVRDYYLRFVSLWPTVEALAAAPLTAVLVEWAGLGYYARARNLHACAVAVVEQHGGLFPSSAAELLTLPGIGPYTAAAIAAIAFDERVPVIDGNVDRVLARYLAIGVPLKEAKDSFRATLDSILSKNSWPAHRFSGDFAQALMDLGATVCAPKAASCMLCPLQPGCEGARLNPLNYPVKTEKYDRPTRYGHAFVMRDLDGDIYLQPRADTGLLAKMTETPTSDWTGERTAPRFPLPAEWRREGQVIHIFTHFRLELDVWSATVDPASLAEGWWAPPQAIDSQALPIVFRKVLAAAGVQ
jgi:A/G-specific adenine glycosylase